MQSTLSLCCENGVFFLTLSAKNYQMKSVSLNLVFSLLLLKANRAIVKIDVWSFICKKCLKLCMMCLPFHNYVYKISIKDLKVCGWSVITFGQIQKLQTPLYDSVSFILVVCVQ